MTVTIHPSSLCGDIKAPPSKSMAHRLLIAAGLCGGRSTIGGISDSEDMKATLDVLRAMGVTLTKEGDTVTVLCGVDPRRAPSLSANCRESGSTLRFFLPLCLLSRCPARLYGSPRLLERPLGIYRELCRDQGLVFEHHDDHILVCGPLRGGRLRLAGDVSSQFITGLLFALPHVAENSLIELVGPIESRSYIDMTLSVLRDFGIDAAWQDERTLSVGGNARFIPHDAVTEGDHSNAAFFLALAALGHDVTVSGLPALTHQGDGVCADYFKRLTGGAPTLDIANCPDLGPILMAVAAAKHGATLTHTRRLAIKESDRGAAMAEELSKFGVRVDLAEDTITVHGGTLRAPTRPLCGHNDHRIVMSLATLCTLTGGTLEGAEAVAKSLPDYFSMLSSLGGDILYEAE